MTTRIIAIANQKGGVGKTTVTLGLAAAVALTGRRVLVLDMDPQANVSQTLLPDYAQLVSKDDFYTTNDILEAGLDPAEALEAIMATSWEGVDLIPSQQELANRDAEGATGIEMRLRRILKALTPQEHPYDVVLLDCPPSVGRLTVNAFLAAHEILLVSGPDGYGQNALNQIEATLKTIRESYEHDIVVAGLVVNKWRKTREATLRTEQLRERFGQKLLMVMPERTVVPEAAGNNLPVFALSGDGARTVSECFVELARSLRLLEGAGPTLDVDPSAATSQGQAVGMTTAVGY